jgi:hypothetical protein
MEEGQAMTDPNAETRQHQLVSVPEAAAAQGLPEETVRGWIEGGELPSVTMGHQRVVDAAVLSQIAGTEARRARPGEPAARTRHRRPGPHDRRRSWRALGAVNLLVALVGGLLSLGVGAADGFSPVGLLLAGLCALAGALLWGLAR